MAFKFVAVLAFVAAASAGVIDPHYQQYHAAPVYKTVAAPVYAKAVAAPVYKQVEYEQPAEYDFSYSVHDEHTGDIKSQKESRKGDAVQGSYSLIDSDGYERIVEYTADDHTGFNAVVRREPTQHKVPVAKIVAPVAHYTAAPVAHYAAAPVAHYATPVAKVIAPVYKAAPVAHYSEGHEASHVTFNGPSSNYHY